MNNTNLFSTFIKIRSNKGDQIAHSHLIKAHSNLIKNNHANFDDGLQQISGLYQTQLNNSSNNSNLFRIKSKKHNKKAFKSFNSIFDELCNMFKNNFEIYNPFIENKIKELTSNLNKSETEKTKYLMDLNLIHNIDKISYYLNEIRKSKQISVIELLIIKRLLKKITNQSTLFFSYA